MYARVLHELVVTNISCLGDCYRCSERTWECHVRMEDQRLSSAQDSLRVMLASLRRR